MDDIKVFSPSQRIGDGADLLVGGGGGSRCQATSCNHVAMKDCAGFELLSRDIRTYFEGASTCKLNVPNVSKQPETTGAAAIELFHTDFKPERRRRRSDLVALVRKFYTRGDANEFGHGGDQKVGGGFSEEEAAACSLQSAAATFLGVGKETK